MSDDATGTDKGHARALPPAIENAVLPAMSDAEVDRIVEKARVRARAVIREKNDAPEAIVVARAMGLIHLFADVPDGDEFLNDYATTIGPVVYLPRRYTGALKLLVLAHEFEHVAQFWRLGAQFGIDYIGSTEWRAVFEMDAETAMWEVMFYLTGTIPPRETLSRLIEHGYASGSAGVHLGHTAAESRIAGVAAGTVTTRSGAAMIDELRTAGIKGIRP